MLVYGDRQRIEDPRRTLETISAALDEVARAGPGIARHGRLTGAFVEAGMLAQGLADARFEEVGEDDGQAPGMDLLMGLAHAVARSWRSGFARTGELPKPRLEAAPCALTLKVPEGYAFYAVYPEAYLEAARATSWTARPKVVGVRSIGIGLAAMVAVGAGAAPPVSVRPVGHPFDRRLKVSDHLLDGAEYAVADEGPGLSGSSFGCVMDRLEAAGTPRERIVLFPSHRGRPGPQAGERRLAQWAQARRSVAEWERPPRLETWFADLVGESLEPLRDLSTGAPMERRKFLLRTASGEWLLKFAGLGRIGDAKIADARRLACAGFTPRPVGLRHGFMIERWHGEARPLRPDDRDRLVETLGRYLRFRAAMPAQADAGASPAELAEMVRVNLGLRLAPPRFALRRVRTDNRLHAWEWLRLPGGRLLKTDAVDHNAGHDLIGCQDIAWDVAGAAVEFDLTDAELTRLPAVDPALLAFMRACYCAFQTGLWSLSPPSPERDRLLRRYRAGALPHTRMELQA